jgi:DNA polymerase delta subunit 4
MPTTRRSTGGTASSRSKARPANQTKLAFSNKVTKSSTYDDQGKKPAAKAEPKPEVVTVEPEEEAESADTSLASIESDIPKAVDPIDIEARAIKESQIKKFYTESEKTRGAPRVHQDDITINEKLLRSWDVDSRYGPCIGIDRTKRWKRAQKFGLNPPIEILAILLKEQDASGKKVQRAHLDEIIASRVVE